jgi:nitrogen fixation/metabolism regulation signal transduction histidine kinase
VPEVTEVSYWRLAWFALSVAVSVFWFWFFTAVKHARSEDSLTWSVVCANFLIVVLLTLITSTIWLIILYVADHKKVSNY